MRGDRPLQETTHPVYHPPADLASLDLAGTFREADALTVAEAARRCRGRTGPPHVKVVGRWMTRGRRVRKGQPAVVLPSVLFCGRRLTMPEWLECWQRACAAAACVPVRQPPAPSGKREEARRRRRLAAADRALDAAGVGGKP